MQLKADLLWNSTGSPAFPASGLQHRESDMSKLNCSYQFLHKQNKSDKTDLMDWSVKLPISIICLSSSLPTN